MNFRSKLSEAASTANFHINALGLSFAESFHDMGEGMIRFWWHDRRHFSDNAERSARNNGGSFYEASGPVGEGVVRLVANASYIVGKTFQNAGEALGTGAAMIAVARNSEETWMGIARLAGGIGASAGIFLGGINPASSVGSSVVSSAEGSLAIAVTSVQFACPAIAVSSASTLQGQMVFQEGNLPPAPSLGNGAWMPTWPEGNPPSTTPSYQPPGRLPPASETGVWSPANPPRPAPLGEGAWSPTFK